MKTKRKKNYKKAGLLNKPEKLHISTPIYSISEDKIVPVKKYFPKLRRKLAYYKNKITKKLPFFKKSNSSKKTEKIKVTQEEDNTLRKMLKKMRLLSMRLEALTFKSESDSELNRIIIQLEQLRNKYDNYLEKIEEENNNIQYKSKSKSKSKRKYTPTVLTQIV